MKIAVMGAGAVGCYYGGMLARGGHEVVLIGRPQHVAAIRRDGLLLDTQSFREHVRLQAVTDASGIEGAQVVLCCVKSTDTEIAGAQMKPHLAPGAVVLSLQNGYDNAARLQAVLGREVMPAVVYVATEMAGPGHVRHHGRGNALSAITQMPYGRMVQGQGMEEVMRDVVDECLAVARAEGVSVPGDIREAVQRIATSMAGQLSSTAHDVARGKPSEIDHLNGYVLRRGAAHGIATPVNRVLHTLVKLLESRPPAAAT